MSIRPEHIVPLSDQAVEVVKDLQPLTGHHGLVFPDQSNFRKPMSENAMLYAMHRMGYHKQAAVHGFPATASTSLNESGFTPDTIARQLAQAERNKVCAAYHRAECLEERWQMMQWWADYLDGVGKGGNEIPLLRSA